MEKLTRNELALMELTGSIANGFIALPDLGYSDSDQSDVYFHLRAIQNIILARPSYRVYVADMPNTADKNIVHEPTQQSDHNPQPDGPIGGCENTEGRV